MSVSPHFPLPPRAFGAAIQRTNSSPDILSGLPRMLSTPESPSPAPKRLRLSATASAEMIPAPQPWSRSQRDNFETDMCRMFLACGWPWASAGNPIFESFFWKWVPGSTVPSPEHLSGTVLDREVIRVEGEMAKRVVGEIATGQCDGWKNVAKVNLVTSLVTVNAEVSFGPSHFNFPPTNTKLLASSHWYYRCFSKAQDC